MANLRDIGPDEYRALYEHMRRDFPANERPPFRAVKNNLEKGVQRAMHLEQDGRMLGYAMVTAPEGLGYALVNFLAVLPEVRGGGHGTELLRLLDAEYPSHTLVLEVEDPDRAKDTAERTTRERRIAFYRRAGYEIVPTNRFVLFGVPMLVMMNRGARPADVRAIFHALYLPTFGSGYWLRFVDVENGE